MFKSQSQDFLAIFVNSMEIFSEYMIHHFRMSQLHSAMKVIQLTTILLKPQWFKNISTMYFQDKDFAVFNKQINSFFSEKIVSLLFSKIFKQEGNLKESLQKTSINVEPVIANLLCHIYGNLIMNCNQTEETYVLIRNMMSCLAFKKGLMMKMWYYFLTFAPK